jgi:hypothetical protein
LLGRVFTMIRNRNEDVQRLMELAAPDDAFKGNQEIKVTNNQGPVL